MLSPYWHGVVIATIAMAVASWPLVYRLGVQKGQSHWRGPKR